MMETDRKKIIRVSLLVAVPLLLLIGVLNAPSIITIEAEEGATISVTDEKDGVFKDIGTTKSTRWFFQKPATIYISVELDGKRTITSTQLQRFKRQTVKLDLIDTVSAKKITDGAVTDVIFNGDKGQGVVTGQDTLVNFSTSNINEPLNPAFISLPYIKEVVWYSFDTFVYLADDGVGQFSGGVNRGLGGVGATIRGDVNVQQTNDQGSPLIKDISKAANRPLVLLSNNNIFTSDRLASDLRAIVSFDSNTRDTRIFTTADSIYKVSGVPLTDDEESEINEIEPEITIEEFTYAGEKLSTTSLDDDAEVLNVVKKNDITYVLTLSGLHAIQDGEVQKKTLYFTDPAGMTIYKDMIVVLGDDGLWNVSDDGNSFQLLTRFSDFGVGLAGSMTVDANDNLIFGTRPKSGEPNNSATFSISL